MSTLRDLATWTGHAFLFCVVLAAIVMSWGGGLLALLAFVALLVKAVGAAVPWSWGAIVFGLVGSLLVSWVGRILGRAIGDDADPVPPTADLSAQPGWREREISRPAPRPSPRPVPRAPAPSHPRAISYSTPVQSSSTADDILTAAVIHDIVTHHEHHHHDDCGSSGGSSYEASCGGGCDGD